VKKTATLLYVFLFFAINSFAQQVQKYYRIKIQTGKNGLVQLAKQGIAVDHGEYKKGSYFIGEFSDNEVAKIKQTGLSYEILISDMSAYYAARSIASAKTMQLAGICNNCPGYQTPANFTLGSMGGFYIYQELLNVLDSMVAKYPTLISPRMVLDTGHTWEGRQLYYVRVSNSPNVNQSKPQLLYTALHHAREPESLSQLIYYMWYLLENYNTSKEIKYLVDNLEMYFVPCVNPDGYIYNYATNPNGGGYWRKNRRDNGDGTFGVDLNRNYGTYWGADDLGSSPNTGDETYRGPSAFSEPETQMMRNFCNKHTFKIALNNHTYSNVLVQPGKPDSAVNNTFLTPDSATFNAFSMAMTFCDGFGYGTDIETVDYTTNGISDQWMYTDTVSKPKILAMTPEAGSVDDGFYPAQSNIIPIAAYTMDQNIYAARFTTAYAKAKETYGPFISQSGYITYTVQRLGLLPGTFSVSITPIGNTFQNTGTGKTYSNLAELQSVNDSISFSLVNGLPVGTVVNFMLNVSNGSYTTSDTITCVYGTPVTAFYDNCNSLAQWNGTWIISTQNYVSYSGSITDTYNQNNAAGASTTTTLQYIDLTDAIAAYLQFDAFWSIEKNYDYAEVQASTDGNTFTPLCGEYTHSGDQDQDPGMPVYDGNQSTWVKETINLSAYLGQTIQLRFDLETVWAEENDNFYFDEISVKKITPTSNGIKLLPSGNNAISIYPNPNNGSFIVTINSSSSENTSIAVTNVLGERVYYDTQKNTAGKNIEEINLAGLSNGAYFVHIQAADINFVQKIIISH
jgi:carboxypeptidase T